MIKIKKRLLLTFVLVSAVCYSGSAFATTYFGYDDFGGTWHDANKNWVDDSAMCWAAAASNVLASAGWGYPSTQSFANENDIFGYYRDHFTNRAGGAFEAMKWWFDGLTPNMFAQLESPGGGFWNAYNYYDQSHYIETDIMSNTDTSLHAGDTVALNIGVPGFAGWHVITLWGFDYALDVYGNKSYAGVYVTDSDDGILGLQHYGLNLVGNKYFLDDRYSGWYILHAIDLDRAPFSFTPVPEPTTMLLLGLGLIGLAGIRKRMGI